MHTKKNLMNASKKGVGFLYDYIANYYYEMTKYELKEVLLSVIGVCLDKCAGDEDEEACGQLIAEELSFRDYGSEDEEDDN